VRATRVTSAKGNVAAIVSDVTLENLSSDTKT
jgi:hypothetical protein